MVVGGAVGSSSVEVIDFLNPEKSCFLPDYPTGITGAVGTFMYDRALVCGGSNGISAIENCYYYRVMQFH